MSSIFGRVFMQPCLNQIQSRRGQAALLGILAVGLGFYLAHPHFFDKNPRARGEISSKKSSKKSSKISGEANASQEDPGQCFDLGDCTLRYLPVSAKAGLIQIARDGKILFKQSVPAGEFKLLSTDGADNRLNIYTTPLVDINERDVVAEVLGTGNNHQYTVIALARAGSRMQAPQVVARLSTGKNNLQYLDGGKGSVFGLSTSDTFEGWGAEPVSPTLNYHLVCATAENPARAHLQPIRGFIDTRLLSESIGELKGQFADLMIAEDAPITFAPASLADEMAGLIYAGHKKEALKLMDNVWPKENPSRKKRFYAAFIKELAKSPNWAAVEKLN